jgi:hypothetical protein
MTIQQGTTLRNAMLDAIETTVGTAPKLLIFSGAVPVNCAAADPAGLLATLTLPSDWAAAANAGSKALAGTWSGTSSAAGTAASYRLYDSGLTTCHEQGTVTATGGGGDLTLDNAVITNDQTINITTWTRNAGNA